MMLGATLYAPATRRSAVMALVKGEVLGLAAGVICLEDAVRDDEVEAAAAALPILLAAATDQAPPLYVRFREPGLLRRLASLGALNGVRGIVVPKADPASLPGWLGAAADAGLTVMPTVETRIAFEASQLGVVRAMLLESPATIDMVRIGGNDLLALLNARRSPRYTAYEGPLGGVIGSIVTSFIPAGFAVSAPVFEHFLSDSLLADEFDRDIDHGMFNKTIIHPRQVAVINRGLIELAEAHALLRPEADGVFSVNGSMCEPKTHSPWAETILRRAERFGIRGTDDSAPVPGTDVRLTA
jgi:citrate lyase beta subunit